MAVAFGTDISTFPDLDDAFAPLAGMTVLAQSIARSLEDARYGVDLRQWLNESLEDADVFHLQQAIEAQCLADEAPAEGGPFRLVLNVTSLGIELLSQTP